MTKHKQLDAFDMTIFTALFMRHDLSIDTRWRIKAKLHEESAVKDLQIELSNYLEDHEYNSF